MILVGVDDHVVEPPGVWEGRLPAKWEHVITCFIDDAAGVRHRDRIGVDTITWECDHPDSDSTWPNAPETLARSFDAVSEVDIERITHLNAMRHFRYDPFAVRPKERCRVGALRQEARHVDLSLKSAGGAAPAPEDAPFVTIGHVMKQLASAFATPFDDSGSTPGSHEPLEVDVRRRMDRSQGT